MTTTERAAVTTGVVYDLQGTLLEACSCLAVCPCWVGQDPDGGSCDAFNAYRFQHGTIRGIDVSGLSFINVVHIPGNVLAPGSWQVVSFVDDRASDEQFQTILDAYHGRLGGPLADLAGLVGEVLAVKRAPIVHETREGGGSLGVVLRGPQRHPVRLPHRLHRRAMSATLERGPAVTAAYAGRRRLPVAVPVAIALAWLMAYEKLGRHGKGAATAAGVAALALAALVALHPSWMPPVMASLAGALGG
jgi:hypothetical protein